MKYLRTWGFPAVLGVFAATFWAVTLTAESRAESDASTCTACTTQPVAAELPAELPKANFQWKALWVRGGALRTSDDVRKMVDLARRMGVNAIIFQANGADGKTCYYDSKILTKYSRTKIDPLKETVVEAKKAGIDVYAWVIYLLNSGGKEMFEERPDLYQVVLPAEQDAMNAPRVSPDRPNVQSGHWLCPDRGLADHEKALTEEVLKNYDVAGISVDYLGYQNYHACFCEYSNRKREEFAKRPENAKLSKEQIEKAYSEQSLAAWSRELYDVIKAVRPDAKIAAHVYPDFDPNPFYGNRLYVDYCGQTIAWSYKPFWSYEKIYELARGYHTAQGKYHAFNRAVPYIGIERRKLLKSSERLRREIRIAGFSGAKDIMFGFYTTFRDNPELVKVMQEELAGTK